MNFFNKHNSSRPLANKTIVICGASSGIGRATALEFARKGCSLILVARRKDVLENLSEECLNEGADMAISVKADVREVDSLQKVREVALNATERIDIWINNAGIGAVGKYDEIPMHIHEQVVRTNLMGHMNGAYAVLPVFKKQGYGTMINTISLGGWVPEPYAVAYSASKFGLRGFSESIRCELRNYSHIHICDVFLTYMDTPGFQHAANYVGKMLKPVPPVFPARRVAKAMVKLANHPKDSVSVGEFAPVFKALNRLTPALMRSVYSGIVENYFERAKPAPVSDGAVLEPIIEGTGISGGWIKPDRYRKKKIILGSLTVTAGLVGAFFTARSLKS